MSVNLSFDLNLKERVSGAIQKLGATTRSVFNGIDNTIKGTQSYLDKLGEEQKVRVDTSELERAHGKMKEVASTWEVMRGTMMGEMAFRGIERGVDFVKDFMKESLEAGMDEQKVQTTLKVMKGDEEGKDLYEKTHANLLESLYGTQLYAGAKSLTAIGLNTDAVMKKLSQFEDIAASDKGNFDQLINTYSLVKGTGHINLQELRPLLGMGFNPEEILQNKYGGKQDKWHERMEDATNGVKYFDEALRLATEEGGKFYNLQKRMMDEPVGKFAQSMTNWENTKAEFGEKMLPTFGKLLDALKPSMDRLPGLLERLIPHIESLGNGIVKWIEWGTTHTKEIKDNATKLWHLTEAVVGLTAVMTLSKAGGALMGGLRGVGALAEGAEVAGWMSAWKLAGMGAGAFESMTGIALGTVGGIAGLIGLVAYEAWDTWKSYKDTKAENVALAKGYEAQSQNADVKSNPNNPGVGYLTREQMEGKAEPKAEPKMAKEKKKPDAPPAWMKDAQAKESADAIVGGGHKQVIMNFYKPLYNVEHQVFQRVEDGLKDFDQRTREAVLKILYAVPGMI